MTFKRMYSHKDLNKPLTEVVAQIPPEKLDWAMTQVGNSVLKIKSKEEIRRKCGNH